MKQMLTLSKCLLAFATVLMLASSTRYETIQSVSSQQAVWFPVLVFASAMLLHWLVWQFVVPEHQIVGPDESAFLKYPAKQSFYSGMTTLGYAAIAIHCWNCWRLSGGTASSLHTNPQPVFLVFGLIAISVGMAARWRRLVQHA